MKIAILSYYSGQVDRGVETWARNLHNKINSKYKVKIISGAHAAKNTIQKLINFTINIFENYKPLISSDVIVPTNGSVQTLVCRLVSFVHGKPMIVFGHAGPGADDKWNLLCSPNVFVAFTTAQKKWAEKFKLPWTKIVVIPHAVDTQKFTPAKIKPRKKIVLCVAANIPSKRIGLVKNAVEKLKGYKFLAVGKGNPIEASFDKMPEIYRKADVFCFVPWEREAFGLVFLEALASNLPVVTVDDEVRREIVGNAGIFVNNPENISELALAIDKACRTNWGAKPRKQAEEFAWSKIIIAYEKFFDRYNHY